MVDEIPFLGIAYACFLIATVTYAIHLAKGDREVGRAGPKTVNAILTMLRQAPLPPPALAAIYAQRLQADYRAYVLLGDRRLGRRVFRHARPDDAVEIALVFRQARVDEHLWIGLQVFPDRDPFQHVRLVHDFNVAHFNPRYFPWFSLVRCYHYSAAATSTMLPSLSSVRPVVAA